MGVFIYNIFLLFFGTGTRIAALFNAKAKKWVQGRRNIFERLEAAVSNQEKIIWMHCASLGEFEQGRPLIERLKARESGYRILLTFFSPSGYEVRKNYDGADWVFYLPMDGAGNARRFLEIVQPSLVIFVKYEFWYYYLKKIKYREIPLILVSALFRKEMSFFKWYGGIQRKILSRFDHIFVQDSSSMELLDKIGLGSIASISGDTRFDRVIEIANQAKPIPVIEQFVANSRTIIAGSTWPDDEEVLQQVFYNSKDDALKLIIAPHEIDEKHLDDISRLFPGAARFSKIVTTETPPTTLRVLIIDNIGLLSQLYRYAWISYVGGGLKHAGVHNVLEAAVYDKIVLFGPNYQKYSEAIGLARSGGGIPFDNERKDGAMLIQVIEALRNDKQDFDNRSSAAGAFVRSHQGATGKIINYIQENRLLTS